MEILRRSLSDVEAYSISELLSGVFRQVSQTGGLDWKIGPGWFQTLSARSALKGILLYLQEQGRLGGRRAQILVPQWTCNAIHQTIQKVCKPVNRPTTRLVGVMIYHQYGFKQNITEINKICQDRNLFVLENSVNCFESFWAQENLVNQSTRVASIFSWPKLFPVIMGGALQTEEKKLIEFFENYKKCSSNFVEWWAPLTKIFYDNPGLFGGRRFTQNLLEMSSSITDFGVEQSVFTKCYLNARTIGEQYKKRQENYYRLRKNVFSSGLMNHLDREAAPYMVPLLAPRKILESIGSKLIKFGVCPDLYHFDINRNIFDPDFRETLLIPVHGGITDHLIDIVAEVVSSEA